jgi:hypothetical protein
LAIRLDATTAAEYAAATTAATRAQAVVSALGSSVTVKVYDGSSTEMGAGTLIAPWATASSATITVGEVNTFAVTQSGTPDETWTLQFAGNSRTVTGSFGLSDSGADFTWSLASWATGQTGSLGTITLTATGNTAPIFATAPTSVSLPFTGGTIQFTAYDPDGSTVTYSLASSYFVDIDINPSTGLVSVPASAAGSSGNITVRASDGLLTTDATCAVSVLSATVEWNFVESTKAIGTFTQGTAFQHPLSQYVTLPTGYSATYTVLSKTATGGSNTAGITVNSTTGLLEGTALVPSDSYSVVVDLTEATAAPAWSFTEAFADAVLVDTRPTIPSWYDFEDSPIVVANMPGTTNNAARSTWGDGVADGSTTGGGGRILFTETDELWFSAKVWMDATLRDGHLFYFKLKNQKGPDGTGSDGTDWIWESPTDGATFYLEMGYNGGTTGLLSIDNRDESGNWGSPGETAPITAVIANGQPHTILARLVLNTLGQANGIIQVWLDGSATPAINVSNWRFRTLAANNKLNKFILGPYRQGTVTGAASLYVDDIYLGSAAP